MHVVDVTVVRQCCREGSVHAFSFVHPLSWMNCMGWHSMGTVWRPLRRQAAREQTGSSRLEMLGPYRYLLHSH